MVVHPSQNLHRVHLCAQQGYYEFDVDVAFYEIFDEMITDLLQPDNLASSLHLSASIFSAVAARRALFLGVSCHPERGSAWQTTQH